MTFTDYAAQKGILLLSDDIRWLRSIILTIPKSQRASILKQYTDVWCNAMIECKNPIKQQNEGRRAANRFIGELHGYLQNSSNSKV